MVKVGSSSLTTAAGGIDPDRVRAAGRRARRRPRRAAPRSCWSPPARSRPGSRRSACARRPRALAAQQAAASVGQGLLVHRYTEELARHGVIAGQVLLTVDDVTRRSHYRNAYQTFAKLLELGVLPIVNENDTVATTEIRFGDNDRLAALVAHLVHADLLVLLSDVDGLYDGDPARPGSTLLIPTVRRRRRPRATCAIGKAGAAGVGTGGMQTKVEAARIATGAGIPVVLTAADQAGDALAGEPVGTLFHADRQAPARPGCSGWRTRPSRRARCCSTPARCAPSPSAGPRCSPPASPASTGTFVRRRPGRPRRPRRARRSPAGWSTSTPTELPALLGRSSQRPQARARRGVRARGRAPRRPRAARDAPRDATTRSSSRLYGRWDAPGPGRGTGACMAGFPGPVVGGRRLGDRGRSPASLAPHEDVDVVDLPARTCPAFRGPGAGAGTTSWSAGGRGAPPGQRRLARAARRRPGQVWLRAHAARAVGRSTACSPRTATASGSRAARSASAPLDEATWVAADGIRYLQPRGGAAPQGPAGPPEGPGRPGRRAARAVVGAARLAARRRTAGVRRRSPVAGRPRVAPTETGTVDGVRGRRQSVRRDAGERRTLEGAMNDTTPLPVTVYLDHAATTPMVPAAVEAMTAHLRRRQPELAARLRAARPPGRRGVPRDDRPGAQLPARARSSSPPAAPRPTTSRSRASTGRGAPPTRAAPASCPPRSSTTPCSTRWTGSATTEGAEVELLPVDARGRLDVDALRAVGRARPRARSR